MNGMIKTGVLKRSRQLYIMLQAKGNKRDINKKDF